MLAGSTHEPQVEVMLVVVGSAESVHDVQVVVLVVVGSVELVHNAHFDVVLVLAGSAEVLEELPNLLLLVGSADSPHAPVLL